MKYKLSIHQWWAFALLTLVMAGTQSVHWLTSQRLEQAKLIRSQLDHAVDAALVAKLSPLDEVRGVEVEELYEIRRNADELTSSLQSLAFIFGGSSIAAMALTVVVGFTAVSTSVRDGLRQSVDREPKLPKVNAKP